MNDNLDQLTNAELSDAFAVTMGVPCDPDDYATSADAVLPWLEKQNDWQHSFDIESVPVARHWMTLRFQSRQSINAMAPTFARAACISLIRAKRATP